MSHTPYLPKANGFNTGNEAGVKGIGGGSKCHANTPVSGQMKLGEAHCVGDRKGRFKGEGYDLRNKASRFSNGTRLSKADQAGGQKGAGHKSPPKGHKSLAKGGFAGSKK